jgi:hypothetical protein
VAVFSTMAVEIALSLLGDVVDVGVLVFFRHDCLFVCFVVVIRFDVLLDETKKKEVGVDVCML